MNRRLAAPRRAINSQGANPSMSVSHFGARMAAAGVAEQGRALGNMIGQTMDAIGRENYSRVAQAREARRQAQERFLQSQQLQVELERIRQERELAEKQMKMAAAYSTRRKKMFDI